MTNRHHDRICVDPDALGALKRDGMGWGHDLDCGCLHVPRSAPGVTLRQRVARLLGKGVR